MPLIGNRDETEGSYFQVFCSISRGSLPLFFEWTRNGQTIKSSPDVNYKIESFERFSTFTIEKIDRRDVGNYSCVATNALGTDIQSSVLTVKGWHRF